MERDRTSTTRQVGALFSTTATDNAEIVPPDAHRGPDAIWSTEANATGDVGDEPTSAAEPEDAVDGEVVDEAGGSRSNGAEHAANGSDAANGHGFDGANGHDEESWTTRRRRPPEPHPGGGVFTAEPVARADDVLDEEDIGNLDGGASDAGRSMWSPRPPSRAAAADAGPLFSSGRGATHGPEGRRDPDPWEPVDARTDRSPGASPFVRHVPPPHRPPPASEARPAEAHPADAHRDTPHLDGRHDEPGADPNGLRAAVSRLDPADVERTSVPIAVVGALLHTGETVQGAVTGQMLGRPAVVVLTGSRVLVVNDRRWQPIVDEFVLDASLVVRGRHDRNVAALSFADSTRLAMVDGITEVDLAIELAERIRDAGPS